MTDSLLPWNATAQEIEIEDAARRIESVPIPIRTVWNPDTCPEYLLPWLAWAFSVDNWSDAWTAAQKRAVIKSSAQVHRQKGTAGALKRSMAALEFNVRVIEWFEEDADPYTFRIDAELFEQAVDDAVYERIEKLIEDVKNVRSHLSSLAVAGAVAGQLGSGAALYLADCVTIPKPEV